MESHNKKENMEEMFKALFENFLIENFLTPEERMIEDNLEKDIEGNTFYINTSVTSINKRPYQTVIRHSFYNNGKPVILKEYETEKEAIKGHKEIKNTFINNPLPDILEELILPLYFEKVETSKRIVKIDRRNKNSNLFEGLF